MPPQTRSQSKKRKRSSRQSVNDIEDDIMDIVDQVYTGEYFDPPNIKVVGRTTDLKRVYHSLLRIKDAHFKSIPNIIEIADSDDFSIKDKQTILERLHCLSISEVGSDEYYHHLRYLKDIKNPVVKHDITQDMLTSDSNKDIIKTMERSSRGRDSESEKFKTWIDNVTSVPFGKMLSSDIDINVTRSVLDENLAFMEEPKDKVINMLVKLQMNTESSMQSILIHGHRGTGKTALAKSIAKALGRPFKSIPIAGESDASVLNGHHFTYTGAVPGRIISTLSEAKCMNPVILIDELDKVSKTNHGRDIIGTLIHMTDVTSNNEYSNDRYYNGLQFDLSKVIFIFTANNLEDINPILLDRLFKIKVRHYTKAEELEICKKHIIPTLLQEYKLKDGDIVFEDATLTKLLSMTKRENGLRELRDVVNVIISRVVTLVRCSHLVKLKYSSLASYYTYFTKKVLPEHIDVFLDDFKKPELALSMYM
jgi:ATP-dependent Lon protease